MQELDFAGIAEKARLIETTARDRDVSLGEAYVIARKSMLAPSLIGERGFLDAALSQLIWEKTRHWRGDPRTKPGFVHVMGIVQVSEDSQISLAEAARIAIAENRDNEHWEAIAWAIKFLGQKAE